MNENTPDLMGLGPGKYGPECEQTMDALNAKGVLMIVIGGRRGTGFSVKATENLCRVTPLILRDVADSIEKSMMDAAKQ